MTLFANAKRSRIYAKGDILHLTIQNDQDSRTVDAKILHCHEPFTLSCVLTVEIPGSAIGDDSSPTVQVILKLYDRRFSAQMRDDEGTEPWTPETESKFSEFVESGQAADFISKLRNDKDFQESDEAPWNIAEQEAHLQWWCWHLLETETRVYHTLQALQGRQIPRLYGVSSIFTSELGGKTRTDLLAIPGILLEYIPGPTLSEMVDTLPRDSWQSHVDQAIEVVRSYAHSGVVNKDIRCSNFVINESVPEGHEHRVVMIDFALCELRTPEQSEFEWGRAKWDVDEEGAVGVVMKGRLAKLGFNLQFTPSSQWTKYAWTEAERSPSVRTRIITLSRDR